MKKITQFSAIALLITSLGAYATVDFSLTNECSQSIWIRGYADDDKFTGEEFLTDEEILPGGSFSASISNGTMDLEVYLANPREGSGKRPYKYLTKASANDKNKLLIWNHEEYPNAPLYPETKKRFLGLGKAKIGDNIRSEELRLDRKPV